MVEISVLIPCLNEEKTISKCVEDAKNACHSINKTYEIIVIDNNSTDKSSQKARKAGAKVILEKRKGYGQSYLTGIKASKGKYIFTADGDGTYNLEDIIPFYKLCEKENYDFVLGNRFANLEKDTMPLAHRHIGNPMFTKIINKIIKANIKDSNSGLRMIRASKLKKLNLVQTGMEFTSELLMEAHRNNFKIKEIPTTYRKRVAPAKLRTIRDGLRIIIFLTRYYFRKH
jgi:glycosyltransferase involved in cell wall biosynthesis